MTPSTLLLLYLSFRVKHYACDFLLQTDWMALTKGKPGAEGYKALFFHTFLHSVGTLVVVLFFAPSLWCLAPLDFAVHSVIDRVKGVFTYRRGWTPKDTIFWWTFGLDQEAHNFTHLAYILAIVAASGGLAI